MVKKNIHNTHIFQRIQSELGVLIANMKDGEKLPAEPVLAQQFNTSRSTLREAMRTFEAQGRLRRIQGKGTFVLEKPQVIESGLEVLESIESLASKMGLQVSMGDLHIISMEADEELAKLMHLKLGECLTKIDRIILAENRPTAFLVDILPEGILGNNKINGSFHGSVLDWLLKRGYPKLDRSKTCIKSLLADKDIARALKIQRGDAILVFEADLIDVDGRIVDHSYSYFLPGYFRFFINRKVGAQP